MTWETFNDGLTRLTIAADGCDPTFCLHARAESWDVQDVYGYVFAHGGGRSLSECQARAASALAHVFATMTGALQRAVTSAEEDGDTSGDRLLLEALRGDYAAYGALRKWLRVPNARPMAVMFADRLHPTFAGALYRVLGAQGTRPIEVTCDRFAVYVRDTETRRTRLSRDLRQTVRTAEGWRHLLPLSETWELADLHGAAEGGGQ